MLIEAMIRPTAGEIPHAKPWEKEKLTAGDLVNLRASGLNDDLQNDFLPSDALAMPYGDQVISITNQQLIYTMSLVNLAVIYNYCDKYRFFTSD
jgi:hypothetical protein